MDAKQTLTKKGLERLFAGHPWIFRSDIRETAKLPAGPALLPMGEHWFWYSPQSEIRLRRVGPATRFWPQDGMVRERNAVTDPEEFYNLFADPLMQLIRDAFDRREKLLPGEKLYRLLFSEADLIPGLVVDRFGDTLIAQITHAAVEHFWEPIKKCLLSLDGQFGLREIVEVRDGPSRKREGLEIVASVKSDKPAIRVTWNGLDWMMRPGFGQKTGAFLDQGLNHKAAVHYARLLGLKKAWDLCCFEGGFGIHLAKAGLEVLAVDQSASSLQTAAENAQINGLSAEQFKTMEANVFDFIRVSFDRKDRTDAIVLDPPSFVKSRGELRSALRGFKELNLRSMHCLRKGGLLVSCSCSHHVGREDYEAVLREAAHDARRQLRVLEVRGPSPDHAPLVGFKEGEYLQAWYVEVE